MSELTMIKINLFVAGVRQDIDPLEYIRLIHEIYDHYSKMSEDLYMSCKTYDNMYDAFHREGIVEGISAMVRFFPKEFGYVMKAMSGNGMMTNILTMMLTEGENRLDHTDYGVIAE